MKQIVAFEARDGRRFYDRADAVWHEAELDAIDAMMPSRVIVDENGSDYHQHPTGTRATMERAWANSGYKHPREADDSRSPWYNAWSRMVSTDDQEREWGQPYFARHPNPAAKRRNP